MKKLKYKLLLPFICFSFLIKAQCTITNNTLTTSGSITICANNNAPSINGPVPNVAAPYTYSWLVSNTGLPGSYTLTGQTR